MGEGGAMWFPAPFFNLKKIPQEMTHTQREEGWSSSAQTAVALQHMPQKLGRAQKAG